MSCWECQRRRRSRSKFAWKHIKCNGFLQGALCLNMFCYHTQYYVHIDRDRDRGKYSDKYRDTYRYRDEYRDKYRDR